MQSMKMILLQQQQQQTAALMSVLERVLPKKSKLYIFMNSLLVNHLLMFVSLFLFSRSTI